MSERLTDQEVKQQAENFDNLLSRCNFAKAGKIYFHLFLNDNNDGRYNGYVFIIRYLRINGVCGTCYQPKSLRFYNAIFEELILSAHIKECEAKINKK